MKLGGGGGGGGPRASAAPRLPKMPALQDFQFYDVKRITALYEKEAAYETHKHALAEKERSARAQGASEEVVQAQIAPGPDDPQPLSEEEQAEREALLASGFANWNRRDFGAFIRACEKVSFFFRVGRKEKEGGDERRASERATTSSGVACCFSFHLTRKKKKNEKLIFSLSLSPSPSLLLLQNHDNKKHHHHHTTISVRPRRPGPHRVRGRGQDRGRGRGVPRRLPPPLHGAQRARAAAAQHPARGGAAGEARRGGRADQGQAGAVQEPVVGAEAVVR